MNEERKAQLLRSNMLVKELDYSYYCENEHWMTSGDELTECPVAFCNAELTQTRRPRKARQSK